MRFSIVTPSYNQLRWLKLCIASVADQQGVSFEHIIQDAHTGNELEEWVRENSHAKLVVESDAGMYDAINRGFLKTTGDIVAWLNCDEQYLPGALAKVDEFFRQNPEVDVLFGDAVLLSEEGALLSYRRTILPSLLHTRLVHLNTLSCATFVRRSVIDRGYLLKPEWKAIGDAVWVSDMIEGKLKMAVLPEALSAFTLTSENLGQSSLAFKEGQRLQEQTTLPYQRRLKPLVIAWHRLRKFWHGAYALRSFSTEIYTEASGVNMRTPAAATNLSFTWSHSSENPGIALLAWKWICEFFRLLFSTRQLSQKTPSFNFHRSAGWPLVLHICFPFLFAAIILFFEQQSGPTIVVAPIISMGLMLLLSFFLEPLALVPYAAIFTGTIYLSIHFMQPFDSASMVDWVRLGLRLGGLFMAVILALLFSKSRGEAKARLDQTLQIITNMPTPVIISDPLGMILYANDEAVEFTGLSPEELIGGFYPRLFMASHNEGSAMRDYIKFFHTAPSPSLLPLSPKRDICLSQKGEGSREIHARTICIGKGEARYMITVLRS